MFFPLVKSFLFAALAVACPAIALYSYTLARADWLRADPVEANVDEAIRLDPENPYAYTLRAEYLERAGDFAGAEAAWRAAIDRNRRDAEAWIRVALLAEQRGALKESEECLLEAARVSRTWFPRWTLVNFYLRHGREDEARRWAQLALERSSGDVGALFRMVDVGGMLPTNRYLYAAYLRFLNGKDDPKAVERTALELARMIPRTPPGWPGAHIRLWWEREYPCETGELWSLMGAVDRLLDLGDGRAAVGLWKAMGERGIVTGEREELLTNGRFRAVPQNGGLDWRFGRVGGVNVQWAPERGELAVRLDGRQPESVDVVRQRVFLPAGSAYRLKVESRTDELKEHHGLEWQVRDVRGARIGVAGVPVSEDWAWGEAEIAAADEDRTGWLVLSCRRVPGWVRAEGSARFRIVELAQ